MNFKHYLNHPKDILSRLLIKYGGSIPDKAYLQMLYYLKMSERLDLKNPVKFSEKLQWLKLNDQNPEYTAIVDKAAVKEIVAKKIGREYVIPTLGLWNSLEEIEWDVLPNEFVLKTTHGGGGAGVAICRDKSKFDKESAIKKLGISMKGDIYRNYGEWPYKDVPKRIIAEELIKTAGSEDLKDYKFFCFDGEPKFLKVDFNRFSDHHANYYDLNWSLLEYGESGFDPDFNHIEEKPKNFDEMVKIVRTLSQSYKFIRVDLYNADGKIYFGEMTFFPASGMGKWTDPNDDEEIGNLLTI